MNEISYLTLSSLLQSHNSCQQAQIRQTVPSFQFTAYVVLNHNDGTVIEIDKVEQVIEELVAFAQGCTIVPPGLGWWLDRETKKLYQDKVLVVDVTVSASLFIEAELFIASWIERTKQLLEQVEVFVIGQSVWTRQPDTLNVKGSQLDFRYLVHQLGGEVQQVEVKK